MWHGWIHAVNQDGVAVLESIRLNGGVKQPIRDGLLVKDTMVPANDVFILEQHWGKVVYNLEKVSVPGTCRGTNDQYLADLVGWPR